MGVRVDHLGVPYEYYVREVVKVVDGDTVDCSVDLGFGLTAAFRFRLIGIDTPELHGRESARGREASDFTRGWLTGRRLVVRTAKAASTTVGIGDGHFGRWLAEFIDADTVEHLTAALIDAGFGS